MREPLAMSQALGALIVARAAADPDYLRDFPSDSYKVAGIPVHLDPTLPGDVIELRGGDNTFRFRLAGVSPPVTKEESERAWWDEISRRMQTVIETEQSEFMEAFRSFSGTPKRVDVSELARVQAENARLRNEMDDLKGRGRRALNVLFATRRTLGPAEVLRAAINSALAELNSIEPPKEQQPENTGKISDVYQAPDDDIKLAEANEVLKERP